MAERVSTAPTLSSDGLSQTRSTIALGVKRGLDVSLGLVLAAVTLPVMLLIATAIRLDSPGPALFRARRIGRHGRHFPMLKFRTMVKDAHERLEELAHLNVADGMVKIPNDPRVTRLGKWLRRFSLDELPQLYNILAGHMSLVGPRPHDVRELPAAGLEHEPRLSMRPGLTGLWQVTARSDPRLDSRIHLDQHYVSQWSLLLDATILAKTVPVVLLGRGGSVTATELLPGPLPRIDRAQELEQVRLDGPEPIGNGALANQLNLSRVVAEGPGQLSASVAD